MAAAVAVALAVVTPRSSDAATETYAQYSLMFEKSDWAMDAASSLISPMEPAIRTAMLCARPAESMTSAGIIRKKLR